MNFLDLSTTSAKIKFGVRVAAVLLLILFFVPTLTVSCDETEIAEFSAFDAAFGLIDEKIAKENGGTTSAEDGIDPEFITLIFVAMTAFIFISVEKKPIETAAMAGLSAFFMVGYKILAKSKAVEFVASSMGMDKSYIKEYIEVEGTFAYTLHIILCLGIAGAILYEKFVLDNPDNKKLVMGFVGKIKDKIGTAASSTTTSSTPSSASGRVCSNCGSPVADSAKFCAYCGTKYSQAPEAPKAEEAPQTPVTPKAPATPKAPEESQNNVCPACGKVNKEGAAFCTGCGKTLF